MPKSLGMTGERWFTCARSGWDFPISERVWDNGKWIARQFADDPHPAQTKDPREKIVFSEPPTEID